MLKKHFKYKVDSQNIAGTIITQNAIAKAPRFIFLHGGGAGTKERIYSIASSIIDSNVNILTFDFSGQGESTGELKKSSLKIRTNQANQLIKKFSANESLIICGASMGGYIAIKMLEWHKVDTLILFCPALYHEKAYDIPFDSGFTDIIRASKSWRETDALNLLQNFTGKLLIVIGDKDEVIPSDVIDLIVLHARVVEKIEIHLLRGCPHQIFTWLASHQEELIQLNEKIAEFIK